VEFGDAKAITGIESRRIVIEGRMSVNVVDIVIEGRMSVNVVDSAKWGREVHIQVYAPAYQIEGRNPSKWSRTEIYFPLRDLNKLIDALIKIDLRSRGINV